MLLLERLTASPPGRLFIREVLFEASGSQQQVSPVHSRVAITSVVSPSEVDELVLKRFRPVGFVRESPESSDRRPVVCFKVGEKLFRPLESVHRRRPT